MDFFILNWVVHFFGLNFWCEISWLHSSCGMAWMERALALLFRKKNYALKYFTWEYFLLKEKKCKWMCKFISFGMHINLNDWLFPNRKMKTNENSMNKSVLYSGRWHAISFIWLMYFRTREMKNVQNEKKNRLSVNIPTEVAFTSISTIE